MKYFFGLFLIVGTSFSASAQQGYTYFDAAGGYLLNDIYAGEVSIELGKIYHRSVEILINANYQKIASSQEGSTDSTYASILGGVAYKPLLFRQRNVALNWRFTLTAGADTDRFLAALSAGLELNFFLGNESVLFLRQKNEVVFWADDHFRLGMLAGIKLPLN